MTYESFLIFLSLTCLKGTEATSASTHYVALVCFALVAYNHMIRTLATLLVALLGKNWYWYAVGLDSNSNSCLYRFIQNFINSN